MKIIKLLAIVAFFSIQTNTHAQIAYDGMFDNCLFLGYTNTGGYSGIDLQYDGSLNEYLSFGMKFNYLFNLDKKKVLDSDINFQEFEKVHNFFQSFNAGLYLRLHAGTFFEKLPERFDPFVGVDFSIKNIAGHTGLKYQFTETTGIYFMYSYGFFSSFDKLFDFDDDGSKRVNPFAKTNAFSLGLTFTF